MGYAANLLHAARIDTPGFLTCFPGKGAPMTPTLLGEVRPVRAAAQLLRNATPPPPWDTVAARNGARND